MIPDGTKKRNRDATAYRTNIDDATFPSPQQWKKRLCHGELANHIDLVLMPQVIHRYQLERAFNDQTG